MSSIVFNKDTNGFESAGFGEKVKRYFNSSYRNHQLNTIAKAVIEKLKDSTITNREDYKKMWGEVVKQNPKSTSLQQAERNLCKEQPDLLFSHPAHIKLLDKWKRNGYKEEIFRKYPEFVQFLFDSNMISQMKVTRDDIKEVNGHPCILVEGKWTSWSDMKDRFEFEKSPKFGEIFILDKKTRDVYTYLGNGNGLQQYHPYLTQKLTPIEHLSDEEYDKVLKSAQLFDPGTNSDKKTFIIQIVSSYVKGSNTNAMELLRNRKHPYLRVVIGKDNPDLGTKKGDVFGIGFGWEKKVTIPLISSHGQFRTPDVWEYMPCDEKVVTNIPVTQESARALFEFTARYHKDHLNLGQEIGFHLGKHNCSVYVKNALLAAGIDVPTEISVSALIEKISPDWVQCLLNGLRSAHQKVRALRKGALNLLPACISNTFNCVIENIKAIVSKCFKAAGACLLFPIRALLGDGLGKEGREFNAKDEEAVVKPALQDPESIVKVYHIHLPGLLQEWQRNQKSTVVTKKPVKLAIVP